MPSISVIIPTYNHRDFVLEAIRSVFEQTFQDFEVVIVNDGSPDDTAAVLAPVLGDKRVRYIEQANAGQGAARNRGLSEARGHYIALLDDDDLWPPDKLQWQLEAFTRHPGAVLVWGYTVPVGAQPRDRVPQPDDCRDMWRDFVIHNRIRSPGQTLIRAEALRQVNGFDPQMWGTDDWDLYIRLSRVGPFVCCQRLALLYRSHANNASHDLTRMRRNLVRVHHKHLGRWPRAGRVGLWLRARVRRQYEYADIHYRDAWFAHENGLRQRAVCAALRAVVVWPFAWTHWRMAMYISFPPRVRGLFRRLGLRI